MVMVVPHVSRDGWSALPRALYRFGMAEAVTVKEKMRIVKIDIFH
jgi:hypothetical protein